MTKKLVCFISSFCIIFANTEVEAKSAKSHLKTLTKKYQKIEVFKADFQEIFEWAMTAETVQRKGKLLVTDDDRFNIETEDQRIISNGTVIYRLNKNKNQVIIEPLDNEKDKLLPRRLLLQFTDNFKATEKSELLVDGLPGVRLDLKPNEESELMISDAVLWMTLEDVTLRRLKFIDLNGNTTTYIFNSIDFNGKEEPGEFEFKIPEGAEVFDLR